MHLVETPKAELLDDLGEMFHYRGFPGGCRRRRVNEETIVSQAQHGKVVEGVTSGYNVAVLLMVSTVRRSAKAAAGQETIVPLPVGGLDPKRARRNRRPDRRHHPSQPHTRGLFRTADDRHRGQAPANRTEQQDGARMT